VAIVSEVANVRKSRPGQWAIQLLQVELGAAGRLGASAPGQNGQADGEDAPRSLGFSRIVASPHLCVDARTTRPRNTYRDDDNRVRVDVARLP
jgi:hypothetical protein